MKALIFLAVLALGAAALRAEDKLTLEQARKAFDAADGELNKVYKADIGELDAAKAAKLREAERDWISYRDSMIEADLGDADGKVNHTTDYWEAMAAYAQERAEFLRAWTEKNTSPGISGKYSDSYGGTLELTENKGGIDFSLSVVRGRAHNEGNIEGMLHRNGDKALFKQTLDPGQERPPCELVFTFDGNRMVSIEEKTPDSQAGNDVHYGGDYYKIGKGAASSPTPAASAAPAEKPTLDRARKTFENTDALLTAAYKEAGAGLDQAKMNELRQSERDWIQYREILAKSAPYFNTGAQTDSPKGTADYWQTMNDITRSRVEFLRAYSGKKAPSGITGEYSDSYGGTLELEEKKSGIVFSIHTVRGMARNEGDIEGVAQRTGDKALYKDHPDAGDDRAPCEIAFIFIEGHIVKIEEKNADYYHGFNANFDGVYYKTGKLEKPLKPE